jgi:hypothetical protein
MRFSQIYLERGAPARDSERLRNRLAASYIELRVQKARSDLDYQFAKAIEQELGVRVRSHSYGWEPEDLFRRGELRAVLDAITLLYRVLPAGTQCERWRTFVARVLHEENVGYVVDEKCIAHYHVDQEFERNRVATVAILGREALAGAAAAHDDAYRHLDSDPQDTKAAVRSMFECIEILAKQIVPEAQNINRWQCEKGPLRSKCLYVLPDDTEKKVVAGLLDSLGDWVDALHNYRHGQADAEPVAPSEEVAVYILSTGSAHARQLAQIAAKLGIA